MTNYSYEFEKGFKCKWIVYKVNEYKKTEQSLKWFENK